MSARAGMKTRKNKTLSFDFETLLCDSSRVVADMAIQAIREEPSRFESLLELALLDKGKVSNRAGRALYLAAEANHIDIKPYVHRILQLLPSQKTEGLKKNFLRLLSGYHFSGREKHLGTLVDHCVKWIVDTGETPAVKVYSMRILQNISCRIPQLTPEVIAAIESTMPYGSKGVQSIGKKMMLTLKKNRS